MHFIGAGPGAADLLTLRAVEFLRSSPVCVYAGTYIDDAILDHCSAGTRLVDTAKLDLDAITGELVAAHERGEDVARLCSGIRPSIPPWPNSPLDSTRQACPGTSPLAFRPTRPQPPHWASS
ncbi:Cobalt-precorrin-4 C11-methyltransferase [Rhodococcus sp. B7740]|nr:Cobalt-precorrin-4 C11-methyltransferase [Rhodococcus sp. B7740]